MNILEKLTSIPVETWKGTFWNNFVYSGSALVFFVVALVLIGAYGIISDARKLKEKSEKDLTEEMVDGVAEKWIKENISENKWLKLALDLMFVGLLVVTSVSFVGWAGFSLFL